MKEDSKQYLTEALFQLMEAEDFKKLTVKQVTEKAGVGRATFYRHYNSLEDIIDNYVENLQGRIWQPEGLSIKEEMASDVHGAAERIFRIFYKEKASLQILKQQGLAGKISGMIYRLTLSSILELGVLNNKYQPVFFAGASSAMVLAWIENGMKESPREMADLFIKSLHGYMAVE